MPHINRIRVNNVKYNFGTQFYDDFLMRFSNKNTIYDLANGGGKSVLMLLLLQNMIPNSTLDDKQPIEKLFRTGEGSTTIHSLIEWTLSDVHVKNNFKYMLTGFCARKAKDNGGVNEDGEIVKNNSSNSAIDYFNYVIFYRKFNDNDIKNLPLSKNGERITYTGLKNYLKDLEKKDLSLEVKIFDRKGDYQRFIAGYGLYESEWEIIRGINKTEGHVRTYFETNYKTTRKVVEDLLIEEIIEKSFKNNYLEEDSKDKLAETLLNIKDKLIELSKKKEEINNFDRQIQIIDGFVERISSLKQMYLGMEDTFTKVKRIFNTINERKDGFEDKKERLEVQKEEILSEKRSLGKKVETAKVLLEIRKLKQAEAELKGLKDEYDGLTSLIEALYDKLNVYEGGNYYLEYIEAKKEYDKLLMVMDNFLKDNTELLSKLKEAVAVKKMSDEMKNLELSNQRTRENAVLESEKISIDKLSEEVREADNKLAVAIYEQKSAKDELTGLDKEISSLKNKVSLLLPTQAGQELKRREEEILIKEERNNDIEIKIAELKETEIELRLEASRCNEELKDLLKEREVLESKTGKILNSEDKIKKLKEVYQENDIEKLCDKIEKSYRNMIVRIEKEKQEIEKLKDKFDSYNENRFIVDNDSLKRIIEYIGRYHTRNVISGSEYIASLEDDERLSVVRNNPFIPYSVIVFENAGQIAADWEILKVSGGDVFIPIIMAEEVVSTDVDFSDIKNIFKEKILNEAILDNEKILCMIGNPDNFKKELVENEAAKLSDKINELEKSLERRFENEEVIKEDYLLAKLILGGMVDEAQINPKKVLEEIDEKVKYINSVIKGNQEKLYNIGFDMEKLIKEKQSNADVINEFKEDIDILNEIIKKLTLYRNLEKKSEECDSDIAGLKKNHLEISKRLEALINQNNNRKLRIKQSELELESIKKSWDEKYISYYDEAVYRAIAAENKGISPKDITIKMFAKQDIDVVLEALLSGLVKDNASVSDKEKLLNNYQISMQRSLQHIDYMGLQAEMFENMYNNKDLESVSKNSLAEIRTQINEKKKNKKELKKKLDEYRSEYDKQQGSINYSIQVIEKNYGAFDESLVKNEEINTFLNENGMLLKEIEERLAKLNKEIKNLDDSEVLLSVLKKECDRLMEKLQLKPQTSIGLIEAGDIKELDEEYHTTAKQLDKFINDKFKRSEEFERELSLLIDTLKKLGAVELASEIRMNISMPKNLTDAQELIESFKETNEYIELEKQRVIKGLQDIQIIKENFENQCIQSCVNIRTELERLSRLSRITIDDENIAVINLKIPYINEDLYKDRMSEYIDRIAKGVDSYEKTEEKLKFIRNNLSWKKMFSVIVTDMNSIKLNLYKRERIAEQSRYLPYEEAVGSTGQSQGIYIQFLISIINYISSINSKNSDATGLRKVIFIDNPFGAAKDVYIWEPIFKLLKVNNVQLIVPARGATPAITGRFDVNYVLGQKMCDKVQQTVVVDYFSNVNNEELDYTTLSFEQFSFDI